MLTETRTGRNIQHELVALLRQSVYSRLVGYEDTDDAERLAQDPAMRVIAGGCVRQAEGLVVGGVPDRLGRVGEGAGGAERVVVLEGGLSLRKSAQRDVVPSWC